MDWQLKDTIVKYLLIGLIGAVLVALDAYAKDKIEHPKKVSGEIDKTKTIALYISMLGFSCFAAVVGGVLTSEYLKLGSEASYAIAGLCGIGGRDTIQFIFEKIKGRV